AEPRWLMVDIRAIKTFRQPVGLPDLKSNPALEGLMVIKRGARLSVQPVDLEHWRAISKMGKPQKLP
ncbi:MAG: EVE domain-containing protein, partial [Myxococcota bacterium]